jgi:hypothetical protein
MGVEMREYEDECWDAMGCDGMRWNVVRMKKR